jgi:hypothetical protein
MKNIILLSRPHGGFRLAKQTAWGDEYVAFDYVSEDAWMKLSNITGLTINQLKSLEVRRVM